MQSVWFNDQFVVFRSQVTVSKELTSIYFIFFTAQTSKRHVQNVWMWFSILHCISEMSTGCAVVQSVLVYVDDSHHRTGAWYVSVDLRSLTMGCEGKGLQMWIKLMKIFSLLTLRWGRWPRSNFQKKKKIVEKWGLLPVSCVIFRFPSVKPRKVNRRNRQKLLTENLPRRACAVAHQEPNSLSLTTLLVIWRVSQLFLFLTLSDGCRFSIDS